MTAALYRLTRYEHFGLDCSWGSFCIPDRADLTYPWGEEVGEKELLVTDTSHVA